MSFTKEQLEMMSQMVERASVLADYIPGERIAPYNQIAPPSSTGTVLPLTSAPLSVQTTSTVSLPITIENNLLQNTILANSTAFPLLQPMVQPLQNPFQSVVPGSLLSSEASSVFGKLPKPQAQIGVGEPLHNPFLSPPITEQLMTSLSSIPFAYPPDMMDGFTGLQGFPNTSELRAIAAFEASKMANRNLLSGPSTSKNTDICSSDIPLNLSTPSSISEGEPEPQTRQEVQFAVPEVPKRLNQFNQTSFTNRNNDFDKESEYWKAAEARKLRAAEKSEERRQAKHGFYPVFERLIHEGIEINGPMTELQILEYLISRFRHRSLPLSSAQLQKQVSILLTKPNGPFVRDAWRSAIVSEPRYYRKRGSQDKIPNGITVKAAVEMGKLPQKFLLNEEVEHHEFEPRHVEFLETHAAKFNVFTRQYEFFDIKTEFEAYQQMIPTPPKPGGQKRGIETTSVSNAKRLPPVVEPMTEDVRKSYEQQLAYAKHPNYGRYFGGHLFPQNNFIPPSPRKIAKFLNANEKK